MKYLTSALLLASFVILSFNSSCVSTKKSTLGKTPIEKPKKEGVATTNADTNKGAKVAKSNNANKTIDATVVENKDVFVAAPPSKIDQVFKTTYPSARDILWTKEKSSTHYKANFFLEDNKQSVSYDEQGNWIEIRTQILPDQLPQNIYHAIKKEYPGVFVVSAASIKNANNKASYVAVIRKDTQASEREVTLTDQGVFLK